MQHIAILNQSVALAKSLDQVALMAKAITVQLRSHFAPAWGKTPWTCAFYSDSTKAPAPSFRLWLLDSADVADALGYHDVDPEGHPYGRTFVGPILDSGGTILSGSNSVSACSSHESTEIVGDPLINRWIQMPDGRLVAEEVADPCEGDSYSIVVNGVSVSVSNFILPAWSNAATDAPKCPYDKMGTISEPFGMTPGGYRIVMAGGNVSEEFAAKAHPRAAWVQHAKDHPSSRTAKRLAFGAKKAA